MKKGKNLSSAKNKQTLDTEAKRLHFAIKEAGFEKVEEKTGITLHTFTRWARDGNDDLIGDMLLNELLFEFGISKIFIRTGKGSWKATTEEIYARFEESIKEAVDIQKVKEDIQVKRLIDLIMLLNSPDKELLINICHNLLQDKKNKYFRSNLSLHNTLPKSVSGKINNFLVGIEKSLYEK